MLANEDIIKKSEELVIAAILIENTAFFRVSTFLRKERFYTDTHKEIYQCVADMFDKGGAVDLLTDHTERSFQSYGCMR